MQKKQFWLCFGVVLSVLFNALPLKAQSNSADKPQTVKIDLVKTAEPKEIYSTFLQKSRDDAFLQLVKKIAGRSHTEDLENTLDDETLNLFQAMNLASKDDLTAVAAKATEIRQKKYEELQKTSPKAQQTPVKKQVARGGPSFTDDDQFFDIETVIPEAGSDFFKKINFSPKTSAFDDAPEINRVETASGVQVTGIASKTIELAEATVTRTESADNKVNFDGKTMTTEHSTVEKVEAVSQTNGQKVTKQTKFQWGAGFDVCPDVNGIVRGNLKARITHQTVINLGKEIAALTNEFSVEFKVTGYVNDDAVMTHFDMEGETTESKTGYDRAKQRELVQIEDGISDGSQRIKYQIKDSKPPYEVENERGWKTKVDVKFGDPVAFITGGLSAEQIERMHKLTGLGIQMGMLDLSNLIRSSIYKWQNYECVDVECTAAKNTLAAGESIDVSAVSISKQDLAKLSAKLEGNGSAQVTPKDQFGTPKAVYNLTAKPDGTASITVKSTSRRGIGLGMLEFGKSYQDDKEICDGNWQGTVEIRKTFEEIFTKTTKPGEISSNLRMSGSSETINRYKYEGTVKTGTVKVATANVSLLSAEYDASADKYYLDHANFTDPGECGWNKPTTVKVDSGTELTERSAGEGTTDITIQVDGNTYRVSIDIPKISGTYSRRIWNKPSGYCQPGNNIPSDKTENGTTYFDGTGISFDGTIDPKQPDVLNGTKTMTSSDGKVTTTITWRLKRCTAGKSKPKSIKK